MVLIVDPGAALPWSLGGYFLGDIPRGSVSSVLVSGGFSSLHGGRLRERWVPTVLVHS